MTNSPPGETNLVYRAVESAVFAPKSLAEKIDRINRALDKSKTWGGFRRRMPPAEYEDLMREQFDEANEERPDASEWFDSNSIHGYSEGNYPPWVQPRMDEWLPLDLLRKYAKRERSTINGDLAYPRSKSLSCCSRTSQPRLQGHEETGPRVFVGRISCSRQTATTG